MNSWLDRLATLSRPIYPCAEISEISENLTKANFGDFRDFSTGINPSKGTPAIAAQDRSERTTDRAVVEPPPTISATSLDAQLRMVEEDLAAEGTSLGKEQLRFARRQGQPRKSDDAIRAERWCRAYLVELTPTSGTPRTACVACGDRVLWRRNRRHLWACRSCQPPRVSATVQWFVTATGAARPATRCHEPKRFRPRAGHAQGR